jgi:hypothetical protein
MRRTLKILALILSHLAAILANPQLFIQNLNDTMSKGVTYGEIPQEHGTSVNKPNAE